jgi:membrane associated rhomboid family serine protease
VIGSWFGWNLFSLWRMVGVARDATQGGVALFAHVGGFIVGLLTVRLAMRGRPVRALPARGNGRLRGWRSPRSRESRWARSPRTW